MPLSTAQYNAWRGSNNWTFNATPAFNYTPQIGKTGGFWPTIGSGLGSLASMAGRGLGLLLNMRGLMPGRPTMGPITSSAGGWPIDANGNIVTGPTAIGGTYGAAYGGSGNPTRPGPSPISHTTSVPAFAAMNTAEILRRNQL